MKLYHYLIFVLYRKNIKMNVGNPKILTAIQISLPQISFLLFCAFFASDIADFKLSLFRPLLYLVFLLVYGLNHWLMAKTNYLAIINTQFDGNDFDTKRKRQWAKIALFLWLIIPIYSIIILSYIQSK